MDFLSLSEHDIWMDDYEWETLKVLAEKYRVPGKFSPILGYEWTARNPIGGHHNVYFRDAAESRQRVPLQEVVELDELYEKLRQDNAPDDVFNRAARSPGWRLADKRRPHGTTGRDHFGARHV